MKRWMLPIGLVVLVVVALVVALTLYTRGGSESSAAAFTRQRYEQLAKAQYGTVWESLHPAQQAVVTRDAFVQCGQKTTPDASTKVTVTSEKDEQLTVPEIGPSSVHSVSVTLRIGDQLRTPTDNLILLDGKWRWTMSQPVVDAFKGGTCPR